MFMDVTMDANVNSREMYGEIMVALSERCNLDPNLVKIVLRCADFKHPLSTLCKSSDFCHVHSMLNMKPFKLLKPQRLPNSFQLVIAGKNGNRVHINL
mmetsp:Transcript_43825/g.72794  ORF Transcript_43825/g.72794 Transcript_43825/m.72794 type:complete len:98 (-) Transcript_43825:44-337(-)